MRSPSSPSAQVSAADVLAYLVHRSQTTSEYSSAQEIVTALACTDAEVQRSVKQLEDDGYVLIQGGAATLIVSLTYAGKRQARKQMALPTLLSLSVDAQATLTAATPGEMHAIFRDAEIQHAQLERLAHALVKITRQALPHEQAEAYARAVTEFIDQSQGKRADPATLRATLATLALVNDIPGTPQQMLAVWPVLYQLLALLSAH